MDSSESILYLTNQSPRDNIFKMQPSDEILLKPKNI